MKKILLLTIFLSSLTIFGQEDSNSSSNSNTTSTGATNGIILKAGVFGLGANFKSGFEKIVSTDNLLSGFGFGEITTSWTEQKKLYFLNPIGIEYYKPMGPGSLFLAFDLRGMPFAPNLTGFNPKYDYITVDRGLGLGFHNSEVKFRNYDYSVGYQFAVLNNQILLTPKFLLRDFANEMKETSFYFYPTTFGIGNRDYKAPMFGSFLGLNTIYNFNDVSSVFLDLTFTSPIQLPMPKLGQLFDNNLSYTRQVFTPGGAYLVLDGRGTAVLTGNRTLIGYQHKFGNLGLQFGYHSETLVTKYENQFELPIGLSGGRAGFSFDEFLINKFYTYNQDTKTEIKGLYFAFTYKI